MSCGPGKGRARHLNLQLHVDESGKFAPFPDGSFDRAIVAGVLLSAEEAQWAGQRLRQICPDVRWPLHAALLRYPTFHALSAVVARERSSGSTGPIDEAARVVVAHLKAYPEEIAVPVDEVLDQLRNGVEPGVPAFRELERAACGVAAESLKILEAEVDRAQDAVRQVIRRVSLRVVAAAEGYHSEAVPDATEWKSEEERRYFSMLRCLLQRTLDLFPAAGQDGSLEVRVLSRSFGPLSRRRYTTPKDLRRVRQALHQVSDVEMTFANPGSYHPNVDGGPVLADFVAFSLRPRLTLPQNAPMALRKLEAQSAKLIALVSPDGFLRVRQAGLSHLGATGLADRFIESGRGGDLARRTEIELKLLSPPLRRWAEEQARAWEAHLRGKP